MGVLIRLGIRNFIDEKPSMSNVAHACEGEDPGGSYIRDDESELDFSIKKLTKRVMLQL